MEQFTAGSCIRFGWETFKKRPWFLIGSYVVFIVVVGVLSFALNSVALQEGGLVALIASIARAAVDMLAGMGAISFALKANDDIEHTSIKDFWRPFPFWKYVGATVLYAIVFIVGLVLIIVPGFIWGIMFGFAGYFVIDKGLWPLEALKESKRVTYGHKWELFLLGILSILIAVVGIICLLVGMFIAYPIITIATAHAYRVLSQKAGAPASAA